jgi:predicted lactoylglutathione lyase
MPSYVYFDPFDQQPASVGNGGMVAFRARSWKAVDDFHAAALVNGGACEGAPGLRLHYSPDFYAAYVRDPDGNVAVDVSAWLP